MSPNIGWGLAAAAFAAGYWRWGWPGVMLAFSVVVFWLLLQFSRSVRVLRNAGSAPVGYVASAVMLNSRLKPGMTLMQVLALTRSLGTRLSNSPERWRWADSGSARVDLLLEGGKLVSWELLRDEGADLGADAGPGAPT